jgi:glyoxylase-like metal-dependent hydrolase (beta-lactamase superfamily II)
MSVTARKVGPVEVVALLDGRAVLQDAITDAFPGAPAEELIAAKDRYPDLYGPGDTWRIFTRAWLVRHPGGLLLFDTGVGGASSPSMEWFPEPGMLHDALAEAGVSADDVDTVALSHVHDDHVGGTVDDAGKPAFANARYLLQTADRDLLREAAEDEEDHVVWNRLVRPLEAAGVLDVVDGDVALSPLLQLRLASGHTPGHQVLRIAADGEALLLAGDTWNHPIQLANPDWHASTDRDPAEAAAVRRSLLKELLAAPQTVIAPTHFSEPFERIEMAGGVPTWAPLEDPR